ncbi:Cobalamin-5-phosphate synthase [Pyrobaculum oguniense TE7]|uniref:Adenosylcobinamide-GDP ribazoletransferase n=1 Tax=Pyrobaculum oguniense (strain DSM 13380 / JCM 10595 / TE7) TaxID=698757 RepID=H6QAA7_PYROT|nr:Cobalamin-5-phosphate synthase [Pyrobaculum oguniense TE7]
MRCVKSLIAFFTAYPVGGGELSFKCVWALPYLVAPLVAAPSALLLYLGISPVLAYIALVAATGLHHLDGLADVADALMVRDKTRAREVLDDPRKGTAGVFAVVAAIAVASYHLSEPAQAAASEVFSKAATLLFAGFSKPFKPGLGEAFTYVARRQWPAAIPALVALAIIKPASFAATLVVSLALYWVAYRHLGGANGDVYGYLLEVARVSYIAAWSLG